MPSTRKAKEEGPKPFSSFWSTNTAIMSHLSDEFFCSVCYAFQVAIFPLPQISGALCSKQIVCLSECLPSVFDEVSQELLVKLTRFFPSVFQFPAVCGQVCILL